MTMRNRIAALGAVTAACLVTSCSRPEPAGKGRPGEGETKKEAPAESTEELESVAGKDLEAEAAFEPTAGSKLRGDVDFEEVADGVKIVVEVKDAPAGKKGIHIHEKGDCSDIEHQSMGSHFAPKGEPHGFPSAEHHHLGDLGNIEIGENGKGRLEITAHGANLKPNDPHSYLGRAVIIHTAPDKGVQPTGGAGKPIACAVIKSSS